MPVLNIDPKIDFAFQYLFNREVTRTLLIHVLNQVLDPTPENQVQEVELLNPFNPRDSSDDKLSILDVKARDQLGRQFNVEMQIVLQPHFASRIVYYLARLHQQQLHKAQDYSELRPTLSVVFLDDVRVRKTPGCHLRYGLLELDHHFPYSEDLAIHEFELPKFNKRVEELTTGLDQWLYFLKNAQDLDPAALPPELNSPEIVRAVKELEMLSQSDLERERYEARLKAHRDHVTGMNAAREEGETIGLAKGEVIGLAKGEAIGLAKGEAIGVIHFCERLLGKALTPAAQLRVLALEELAAQANDLQAQILQRPGG